MTCIPNNVEKFVQFSIGGVTFKDSYAFMQSGLDKLVNNLQPDQLCNARLFLEMNEFDANNGDQESVRSEESDVMDTDDEQFINDEAPSDTVDSCDEEILWMGEELERLIAPSQRYGFAEDDEDDNASIASDSSLSDSDEDYSHLMNQHVGDFDGMDDLTRAIETSEDHYRNKAFTPPLLNPEQRERVEARLKLLTRKGVYPYEYMDSFERFEETSLPPKSAFFSSLRGGGISDADYAHAQSVWSEFEMSTMRDYHDLYLVTDVLLLADAMQAFRTMCLDYYKLDPWRYCTVPDLAWDSGLRMTRVRLQLIEELIRICILKVVCAEVYQLFRSALQGQAMMTMSTMMADAIILCTTMQTICTGMPWYSLCRPADSRWRVKKRLAQGRTLYPKRYQK